MARHVHEADRSVRYRAVGSAPQPRPSRRFGTQKHSHVYVTHDSMRGSRRWQRHHGGPGLRGQESRSGAGARGGACGGNVTVAATRPMWREPREIASPGEPAHMPRRPPLPPRFASGAFTLAEARASGIDRRRLSGPEFIRLSRGIYAARGAGVTEEDIVRALLRSTPSAVACRTTAARLLALPLPTGTPDWHLEDPRFRIHLSYLDSHRHDSGRLRWSQLDLRPEEVLTHRGLRITSRTRTLLDLSGDLRSFGLDDLVVIADHLARVPRLRHEQRTKPFATIDQLRRIADQHHGRGARRLREALDLAAVGSDSPAETRLRLAILRSGLPAPHTNIDIYDGATHLGQPDLSWPEWRVCVEHEGPHHRTPKQQERDIDRGERRRDHGWIEIQTTARDLRRGGARAVGRIEEKLRQRGWRGR